VCPIVLLYKWWHYFNNNQKLSFLGKSLNAINKIPKEIIFYFTFISVFSLYSLYIGRNDAENFTHTTLLSERYLKLPVGLYNLFTQKLGFPLLIFMIGLNAFVIYKQERSIERRRILNVLKWIGIFSAIYFILLPLGGYRDYRPYIIRRDTFMPITLCMVYFYGLSAYYLIKNIAPKYKAIYLTGIIAFSAVFTIADEPEFGLNTCEREALEKLSQSSEKITLLESDCSIMEWDKISDYRASELNAQLLEYWGITEGRKLYYQK